MFLLVVSILMALTGAVLFFMKVNAGSIQRPRRAVWPRAVGGGLVMGALLIFFVSIITIVPARNVGIPVTYGVAGDPLPNGLNFKAPWTTVELMPTTAQSLDATGDKATIAKDADSADVYVHNNVRWAIVDEHATSVFYEARDFSNVSDLLVQPKLREAIASVMDDYDPLADDAPTNADLASQIKEELQAGVGERINISSVSVTLIDFSEATKERINALNSERGNTRIAEQKVTTAKAQAEANRVLADSVSDDPNVLVALCLDLIAEGKTPPAGFQCWPGQAEGSSVIVNSSTLE